MLLVQIASEAWHSAVYFVGYVAGWVVRLSPHTAGEGRPVVLVGGYLSRGLFWARLRRALIERGHPVHVVVFGFGIGDLPGKSRQLADYLARHEIRDACVVSHSMGGLIAVGAAQERVSRVVAIATPWHGSLLSYLGLYTPAGRQLRPGSPYLAGQLPNARALGDRLQVVYPRTDQIVWPNRHLRLGRDDEIRLPLFGHLNSVMSHSAITRICGLV